MNNRTISIRTHSISLLLAFAAFTVVAADVAIETAADIASKCYAVGDTVTVSDGTAAAVLGDYVALLDGSTITMEHAGWTLLKDSGGTEYMFAVYEPPAADGDVFFLNFTADANWSAAPWTKVTQNSNRTYPNHADDVAVIVNPSKSWGVLTVDGDGVTVGQVVEASLSNWSFSQTSGRIVPLVFERTDGRPPRVVLSRPDSSNNSRLSFRFGYDGDDGENYLDVSFRGKELIVDFTGDSGDKPAYRRPGSSCLQIGRAKLRVGEGQTIRFENGSPYSNQPDAVQFLSRSMAEITGAETVESRGVFSDWRGNNGRDRFHPAFYRELGEPPAAFERNYADCDFFGAETEYAIQSAFCITNSRPMAKIMIGWNSSGTHPTNNLILTPSVFLQGGFLEFRMLDQIWSDTLFATNDFAKLTIRGQSGFQGNSYGSTRVRHDVRVREFERADDWSTFEVRGFNCRRAGGENRDYLGTLRIDQWNDFAIAPEGVDPSDYNMSVYAIVPWITCTANDNGWTFSSTSWGTEQTFPGVTNGVICLRQWNGSKNSGNDTSLATCGENDNFYWYGKYGFVLNGQDKTIFSLSYCMGETPKYAAGGNFYLDSTASGATLTIKSGAMIMSRQGNWLGQPCDMTKNGKLKLLGSPSYIHAPGMNWDISPTADMDNNMIWTPIIASNDLVKAGGGWLGLAGDQRNIRGTLAVNAGVLYLGYPAYLKMGYLYHNSAERGWPMHGCATDCDFVVRGGAVLSLASAGYTGKDSDGNDVDEPVLAWGAQKRHTIALERSGDTVGGIYVAEGVTGVVYEVSHETEDGEFVTFARGTWGSSQSAAANVDDLHFSGPGVLKVLHDQLVRPMIIIVR